MLNSRFSFPVLFVVAVGLVYSFNSFPTYFITAGGLLAATQFGPVNLTSPASPGEEPVFQNDQSLSPIYYYPGESAPTQTQTPSGQQMYDSVMGGGSQNNASQPSTQGSFFYNSNTDTNTGGGSEFGQGSTFFTGGDTSNTGGGSGGIVFENPLKHDTIEGFLRALLDFAIKIGYVVAIFFIVYSGFKFVAAQGKEAELTKAKQMLLWTIIGTAILIGAQVIATVIQNTIRAL